MRQPVIVVGVVQVVGMVMSIVMMLVVVPFVMMMMGGRCVGGAWRAALGRSACR